MQDTKARSLAFNALSRDAWDAFAPHRERVTTLLTRDDDGSPRGRLCVLGAGNCNDLDLDALVKRFKEVHLVDLDTEAIQTGIDRQGLSRRPEVVNRGGIDLTGALESIETWDPTRKLTADDLRSLIESPNRQVRLALDGPYDVIASTCLLSQLIAIVKHTIGEAHPQFLDAVQAIRLGHLRLLVGLTRLGGIANLITDVVSSETLPNLNLLPENALGSLIPALNRDRNFFHGVNPAVLWSLFRQDPVLAASTADLEGIPPWRWDFRIRVYLVAGFRFRVTSTL